MKGPVRESVLVARVVEARIARSEEGLKSVARGRGADRAATRKGTVGRVSELTFPRGGSARPSTRTDQAKSHGGPSLLRTCQRKTRAVVVLLWVEGKRSLSVSFESGEVVSSLRPSQAHLQPHPDPITPTRRALTRARGPPSICPTAPHPLPRPPTALVHRQEEQEDCRRQRRSPPSGRCTRSRPSSDTGGFQKNNSQR